MSNPTPQQGSYAPPQATGYAAPPSYQGTPQRVEATPTKTTVGETNTYALLAIFFAFTVPLLGIIFGHMGLSQIKKTNDGGRGLALTGTIVGYATFILIAMLVLFYVSIIFMIIGTAGSVFSDPSLYDPY